MKPWRKKFAFFIEDHGERAPISGTTLLRFP